MFRLSVTDLDSFLYWQNSDMELEELLKRLRGEEPPNVKMASGKAFHKLLEHAQDGEIFRTVVDGYEFRFNIDEELMIAPIRELKAETVFQTPSGPVTLVGKVDGLYGQTIRDYKVTERFEAERYADSYQWRCYLVMFGARHFVYDVFQARYEDCLGVEQLVTIYDYHRLPFSAYPGIDADVQRKVAELAELVAKYVPEKRMAA